MSTDSMVLLCLTLATIWFTSSVRIERRAVWFYHLPNESLAGVPAVIVRGEKNFPKLKDLYPSFFGRTGEEEGHVARARNLEKAQKIIPDWVRFPCEVNNIRSPKRPTSVHKLRPGDIDVVAAMGDSLTAGNGGLALNVQQLLIENRGITTIIGGQGNWREFLTLPNMIKEFNPNLVGYASKDSFSHQPESQFNMGELGAMSQDLPFMTRQLVRRIKKDPRVDFNNDWKLVTVWIGANNFCLDFCYLSNASTSINGHKEDLITSFQFLRDNMPRTIVNLIPSLNLKLTLLDVKGIPWKCIALRVPLCPCMFALQYKHRRDEFIQVMIEWQRIEEEVANDEKFKIKDDFTIVLQMITKNLSIPWKRNAATGEVISDVSYLSEDCFHLSQKGYARATNALWNNMLEPVGSKTSTWLPEFQKFLCPTEAHPYIYTWKNSNV